jgi:hypothetical protein
MALATFMLSTGQPVSILDVVWTVDTIGGLIEATYLGPVNADDLNVVGGWGRVEVLTPAGIEPVRAADYGLYVKAT